MTPGITGRPGKCPPKNGSLTVTFLIASMTFPNPRPVDAHGVRWILERALQG
jgi:hypothetical protein